MTLSNIHVARVRSVTRELDTLEYEVSVFGGFEDERRTSEDITETLLSVMQVSAEKLFYVVTFIVRY